MAVKRVTDSYAKGIQAFASARRAPQSYSARPMPQKASSNPVPAQKKQTDPAIPADPIDASEAAIAGIAANLAKAHLAAKPDGDTAALVDYHDIIAKTVASLDSSTIEARHAVYECARQVVYQRLSRIRPALTTELVEQERLALDLAIEKIEASASAKPTASPVPNASPAPQQIAPVILAAKRPDIPQVRHFHGGALRLFGMAAVVCAGIFGYWLFIGKPELPSATGYLRSSARDGSPTANETPAEPGAAAEAQSQPAASPPQPILATSAPAKAVVPEQNDTRRQRAAAADKKDAPVPTRSLATNNLPTGMEIGCTGPLCSGTGANPSNAANFDDGKSAPSSWLSTYGNVASKLSPGVGTPSPTRAATVPAVDDRFERGLKQAKDGDPELAIRYFTDAIRADPNFSDGYLQRGNMLFKNGNPDFALKDFNEAIRINPQNAAAFKARGMVVLYNGDEKSALEDLTRAIQIAETDPTRLTALELFFARRSRVAIYGHARNDERQLFDLNAMIDAYWKNPDLADALKVNYGTQGAAALMATIYRQRAGLYQQRDNIDGAVADLSLAAQLDPAHALAITIERARLLEAAGRRDLALADFRRALELNPRIEEAKQALIRLKN